MTCWRPTLSQHAVACSVVAVVSVLLLWSASQRPAWQQVVIGSRGPDIVVAHGSDFYWQETWGSHWQQAGCSWRGLPLACHFVSFAHAAGNSTAEDLLSRAAAVVRPGCFRKAAPVPPSLQHVPVVLYSQESVANYPCLKQQIADAEISMTYEQSSQVWDPYHAGALATVLAHGNDVQGFWRVFWRFVAEHAAAPFKKDKKDAVAVIISNCDARNMRHRIVTQLQSIFSSSNSRLAVHSYGNCVPNMDDAALEAFKRASKHNRHQAKLDILKQFKFCFAMENSHSTDYVSEKVFQSLVAGCIPVYWGAPNIQDFIPHRDAIIDYAELGSPQALARELERLASDQEAYEAKLAWRRLSPEQWAPGFQRLMARTSQSKFCHLCSYLADRQHTNQTAGSSAPSALPA